MPLPFAWDDTTYLDAADMGPRELYARPSTSQTVPIRGSAPNARQDPEGLCAGSASTSVAST